MRVKFFRVGCSLLLVSISTVAGGQTRTSYDVAVKLPTSEVDDGARVGDLVVTIRDTNTKSGDRLIGSVEMGQRFHVQAIDRDWLWPDYAQPGWISKADVLPVEQAAAHFSRLISQNPRDVRAYRARASVAIAQKRYDAALEDLNAAVQLSPNDDFLYRERGLTRLLRGEIDQAIADYNEAIRRAPNVALYHFNRGAAWENKGRFDLALQDFDAAVRLEPENAGGYNNRSYLLACCPDARYRNGRQALEDATTACRRNGWNNFTYLGTLAAACAENGRFDEAVGWQTRALALAPATRKAEWQARLETYRNRQPHRETGPW